MRSVGYLFPSIYDYNRAFSHREIPTFKIWQRLREGLATQNLGVGERGVIRSAVLSETLS